MKYLLLDTNIYIDMVVSRNGSHKAESYYQLKKLLDYGQIKLLVPKVIISEVFRHVDNEINKVGTSITEIKRKTNSLYWINHSEELEKFYKILKPAKANINQLVEEFNSNSENYKSNYRELFNNLYTNDNCIIIEENDVIVFKAMQRSIYKKRPFHYLGKDIEKDSIADAIIVETIINIKSLISITEEDCIFFISRNPADFSVDKDKNKNKLHEDILTSIKKEGLVDIVKYSTLFTDTLLREFKDEIEEAGLTEQLEEQVEYEKRLQIQESYELQEDYDRESVGLSSLSTDYEEVILELDKITDFMELIEKLKNDILVKCEEYDEKYYELQDLVNSKGLDELITIIEANPLLKIFKDEDEDEDEDEIKDIIKRLIELNVEEEYASFGEKIKVEDYFSINSTLLIFNDSMNNEYKIDSSGFLSPRNDDDDSIYIYFYKNNKLIELGEINVYYGYINFNDDGNVDDGAQESISVSIDNLSNKLSEVKDNIIKDLDDKIDKIQTIMNILS